MHAVFIFDDGLLARLNQVATRCRNNGVRRRALRLLQKHPRREGLWDSEMAAKVSAWVIEKEEAAMVNGYVPETARLRIESMRLSLAERRVMFS
jgi:intergrase/recombinase